MISRKLIYTIPFLFAVAAVVYGCDSGSGSDQPSGGTGDAISFSASPAATRALEDFPNSTIGISATYSTTPGDWRSYGDIENEMASDTTQADATLYGFKWETVKYWPFDGSELIFAAYSPHDSQSGALSLNADLVHLDINLAEDMPDVMYASGNAAMTPYSKTDVTAYLGEFRHALSKLKVIVTADSEKFNTDVKLIGLTVSTPKGKATLDLLSDGDMVFYYGNDFAYDLVNTTITFTADSPYEANTVYLFPGTHDDTTITVRLQDSSYTFEESYTLSDAMFDDNSTEPLTLVRAATTTLTLTVTGTTVQDPNDAVRLQGQLTDWLDKGSVEVTIN